MFWLNLLFLPVITSLTNHHELRLFQKLQNGYNKLVRPVTNVSEPVIVSIGVVLQQIVDVNEKAQVIEVNAWLIYNWHDDLLTWDTNEYGGITDVRFPPDAIWKPDVLLYNSADNNFDSAYHSNLIVYSDGSVNWVPPGIFRSSCKMDVTWFPFDDQTCHLKFGSWSYHGYSLDLVPQEKEMDTSEYLSNGEWILLATPVKRDVKVYTTGPEPYPSVTFFLKIRRRSMYYIMNAILPCVLISLMTLLGFCLPSECGEKITIEMTVLLSVCFFLSMIADMIPSTSETTPIIATFFVSCMGVVAMSVVFTVIVLNLHYRTTRATRLSGWPRTILLCWLPWLLRMDPAKYKKVSEEEKDKPLPWSVNHAIDITARPDSFCNNIDHERCSLIFNETMIGNKHMNDTVGLLPKEVAIIHQEMQTIRISLDNIHHQLLSIVDQQRKKVDEEGCLVEWHRAAQAVDRLCLMLFTAFLLITTGSSILKVSYFKD